MTLQRRSLRSAPAVLNTADKAVWVTGWNEAVDALEAEQAANSRIASLYEELRKAIDEGSESMTHADALKQIAYWQDKCNQVKAVEPVAWLVRWRPAKHEPRDINPWVALSIAEYRSNPSREERPLFAHPAPPAQQVAVTRHMEEQPDGTIIEVEPWVAQQVAVPPGYALAMAVLQSSLYQFLDDVERSECDALIAAAQGAKQ